MADKGGKGSPKKGSPKKEAPVKTSTSPKKSPEEAPEKPAPEVRNEPAASTSASAAASPTGSEGKSTTPVSEAGGDNSWGGWFTRTLSTAKEQSTEMYNYLKQDLTEFSETVQEAGREIKDKLNLDNLDDTVKSAVTTVGSKANVILEQVSTIFGIGPDDEDEELVMGRPSAKQSVRSKMYTMMYDESLFLEDPQNLEDYDAWMARFDLEQENDEIVNLLANNQNLQEHYTKLVPSKVSHLVFWHRFFYLVHVMLEAEKKTAACSAQPVSSTNTPSSPTKSNVAEAPLSEPIADVEDTLDPSLVEISEEDQKRLLAEYEEEMKKCDEESGRNSRRSSGPLSSSSSSSFAFVTHDGVTDEVKVE